jgi:predicted RNA-binding Zn-ribbon protein involved in translation (DUF1610 family)
MVVYKCPRCGYESNQKTNYRTHLQRKLICEPRFSDIPTTRLLKELFQKQKGQYECDLCGKVFLSPQSKYQHKQRCKLKYVNSTADNNIDNDKRIAILEEKISKLESERIHNVHNTTNNTQNIQINLNGQVKLREFGCENLNAIPHSLVETLFMDLKFRELLESLHCDPDYPENHNVRIKSTKPELLEIYRNNRWDVMTFVNGLNELLLQGQRIFKDYYRKNHDKILEEDMDEHDLQQILKQLQDIERLNEDEIKPIRKEIQLMLEGYRGQLVSSS